jgi:Fur family transcriptional regulator, peroxide stress response regulator
VTINEIKAHLTEHGVKPSLPRIKIFDYLIKYKSHPTVDEIYNALSSELVTLSKTTVYNTLDLFIENNIAIAILIEDKETRYDADTSNHGHFKCTQCNKVYDFDYDLSNYQIEQLKGFKATEYHTYIKGICKECYKSLKH